MRQPLQRPLVLVIEDDSRLVSAVAMLIEDWGYDCIAVSSLATIATELGDRLSAVAAVVVDVSVRESFSGARSAAAVASVIGDHVPVIATSSYPNLAIRNGFATVLAKPYEPDDLHRWLASMPGSGPHARKAC